MNVPRAANCLFLILLVGVSVALYRDLPNLIPTHFGFSGTPDAWSGKSPMWFMLPALAVLITAGMYWLVALLPRHPHLLNIPDKERFLALPAERRLDVIRVMSRFMDWVTLTMTVVFALIQVGIYRSANGGDAHIPLVATFFVGPVVLILAAVYLRKAGDLYQ